jgi:predicted acylesterase/phospholipase RssA
MNGEVAMSKKLKVAVVAGGGWSLGAFTGGAVWELVRQLHSNRDRSRYDRFEVDVLAGSGAGALTLAVLLRTLANPEAFGTAAALARVGEAQRAAWLEGMDFSLLMRDTGVRRPALLDRSAIDALATELLSWTAGQPAHPVLLGDRVLLGMNLLNFNGIPIRASQLTALPDTVSTTLFRDHRVFCFDFGEPESAPLPHWRHFAGEHVHAGEAWHEVAATAVASGAVPVAFEPVVLQRVRDEYGSLWPEELEDRDEFPFTYGDGGPFQHQPLREAMHLIALQDARESPGSFERVLIFVDPNLSGSKHAFGLKFHLPYMVHGNGARVGDGVMATDPAAHLVAITNRYGVLARHQTTFEDLLAAANVNARATWRTQLRATVTELVAQVASAEGVSALADAAEARLECTLHQERTLSAAPSAPPPAARDAIAHVAFEQTGSHVKPDEMESGERLAYALMALIDQVADLRGKQEVSVLAVGPTEYHPADGSPPIPVKLAGDFFANFGGFLDARFRVHDFDAGRAGAASVLARASLLADAAARPAYTPWSDEPPSLEAVPAARDRFVRRIAQLTRQLLEYKIGYLGVTQAITIVAHYVAPKLVRDSGPGKRTAIVRIEVTSAEGEADLYLAGGAGGDRAGDARRVGDVVVLHTVLDYSDTEIVGPHVIALSSGWMVRLAVRRRTMRHPFLDIPLPGPAVLHANADCGLPIHRIRVDWAARTMSGWTQEDALREWPGGYQI